MPLPPRPASLLPALVLAVVPTLLASGCKPGEKPPDATYRAFARAAADRDAEAAWPLRSGRARAWLDARARAAAARAPGVVPSSGQRLLFGDASLSRPPREIEVVENDGEHAVLKVTDAAGSAARVALVREGGRWRIDLPEP